MTVVSRLNWATADELIAKCGLQIGGPVQKYIDQRVIDLSLPYVPMVTGALAASANTHSEIGSGEIVYDTPYARYLYYGVVVTDEDGRTWVGAGEHKPVVTDRPLQYDTSAHPQAGAFWADRMKADHMNDLIREVQAFVNRE